MGLVQSINVILFPLNFDRCSTFPASEILSHHFSRVNMYCILIKWLYCGLNWGGEEGVSKIYMRSAGIEWTWVKIS